MIMVHLLSILCNSWQGRAKLAPCTCIAPAQRVTGVDRFFLLEKRQPLPFSERTQQIDRTALCILLKPTQVLTLQRLSSS